MSPLSAGETAMAAEIHRAPGPLARAYEVWERRLAEHGVATESRMRWPRGSVSIYFRDPGNHLLELATPGLWINY